MTVEKNDVNVSSLFNWGTAFELTGTNGEVESIIYMRLVGDEDLNKARVYALRESAKLRKKLRDEESDEHIAFIPDIEDVDGRMENIIAMFSIRDLSKRAGREVNIKVPKRPDEDSSLEEMEKFQYQVDKYLQDREDKRKEFISDGIEKLKQSLGNKSKEELYRDLVNAVINEQCERESLESFRDATTYYGTFKDSKFTERYFDSIEQLLNLPSEIKEQFINAYQGLEVSGDELKKLREATL